MHLLVYCSAGFGKEVMDIARRLQGQRPRWEGLAFLDDACKEPKVYGADVFRLDAALQRFGPAGMEVAIANGEPFVRKALRERLEAAGVSLATLVDPGASVSETAKVGAGTILFPMCFVSSDAALAPNVAIIAGSIIGHDSELGEDCVISGHVNIGGACVVGSQTYVGMGAQLKQMVRVGRATIVGMGSIVIYDLPDEVIALGNPCRPMRPNVSKRVFS